MNQHAWQHSSKKVTFREMQMTDGDGGWLLGWLLGWVDFDLGPASMHHPAWAVGSYSSGPPAGGTPQIEVNPTC